MQHSVDEAWSTAHLMPLQYESMFMGRPDLVVPPDQLAARLGKVGTRVDELLAERPAFATLCAAFSSPGLV